MITVYLPYIILMIVKFSNNYYPNHLVLRIQSKETVVNIYTHIHTHNLVRRIFTKMLIIEVYMELICQNIGAG